MPFLPPNQPCQSTEIINVESAVKPNQVTSWSYCFAQEQQRKDQLHKEMMYGSHPAPVVTRKRHVDPPPFTSPASIARPKQASASYSRSAPHHVLKLALTVTKLVIPTVARSPVFYGRYCISAPVSPAPGRKLLGRSNVFMPAAVNQIVRLFK